MTKTSTYTDPAKTPKSLLFLQKIWMFIKDVTKIIYIIIMAAVILFGIFEIKNAFQIDLVPGVNFIFDDIYREWKGDIIGNNAISPVSILLNTLQP